MTDQLMPDGSASEHSLSAQSAALPSNPPDPPLAEATEAAQSAQQTVLDSIFNKQGEGVQFGSIPVADGIQTGAIPLPGPGSSGSLSRAGAANTGQSRQSEPGNTGSFAQATASSYTGAIPPLTPEDEVPGQTDKPRLPLVNARPIILFDRVSKVYPAQPNKPALNNISMTISSGEFVFLVGHSGSGKSTFIRLINHEFTTSSGRLMVAGEDLSTIKRWRIPYLRRNIGCVFQDFKLLPNKSAFQNVAFALEVIGKSKHIIRTQVPEVLRLVGLEDKTNKYPDQLSGGEQQRVSIARAIVNRPPMLICDEPTGNLDPQTSLGIMRLLDRINRTGTTILVATHDREMVDSMRKRVIALENGFLVRDEDKGVYGLDA